MEFLESLRMAIKTLKSHKLRSFLTTLGVVVGVAAVLTNVGALEGFDAFLENEIRALGANFVNITANEEDFDYSVYNTLKGLPHVDSATAFRQEYGTMKYMGQEKDVPIAGVVPGFVGEGSLEVTEGSSFSHQDTNSVLVSESFAEEKFDSPVIVNSTLKISFTLDYITQSVTEEEEFRVKGIVGDMGQFGGFLPSVYIPISTLNDLIDEEGFSGIYIFAEDEKYISDIEQRAREELDRALKVEPDVTIESDEEEEDEDGGLAIGGVPDFLQGGDKYTIVTQDSVLDFQKNITGTINLVAIGIASISLVVGGIGIANIMLVTVSERTREIGVMKAVGAKNRDVLILFLLESGLVGIIGGLIGLGLGFIASQFVIPLVLDIQGIIPLSWVAISIGISFGVGLVSGLYPAWRAAKMDPVEALSYE